MVDSSSHLPRCRLEIIYADRTKRDIAENSPTLFGGDPDIFAQNLAYPKRQLQAELQLVKSVRMQVASILDSIAEDQFEATGVHAESGPVTLRSLLEQITAHLPHHVAHILGKRKLLQTTAKE